MKYSITYVLEKKNNRPNEVRLRMRVRWDINLSQHLIPYTINPDKWSKETNRCIANTTHGKDKISASVINREIQRYEENVRSIFKKIDNPSMADFKIEFNILIGKRKPNTVSLFDVYSKYITIQGDKKGWTHKYIQKNNTVRSQLQEFKPNLTYSDLEKESTINKFIQYLNSTSARRNVKHPEQGLKNSTVERYISQIKWFLSWSKKNGYYEGVQNTDYKIELKRIERQQKIFFSWSELLEFYAFDFGSDTYNHVRDCISFMSFTSLRHSDLIKLKRSDVKSDHIIVYTEKTDDGLRIDLNDYSREILNKYKDSTFKNDLALPVISNQKMNDYIKEMGKIIGFDEPTKVVYYIGAVRHDEIYPKYELLSTHVGRRSFIVNAIFLGIPPIVVMQWTGHKDYNSMKPYIAIVDELKNNEMDKFNKSPT